MPTAWEGLLSMGTTFPTPPAQAAIRNPQVLCHLTHRFATGLHQLRCFHLEFFGRRSMPVLHRSVPPFSPLSFHFRPSTKTGQLQKIFEKPLSGFSATRHWKRRLVEKPVISSRLVRNEPAGSESVQREHGRGDSRFISRFRISIGKGERFWGLPGNSTLVIGECATLFALPVSLNVANPHTPEAPLIPIALICKNGGNRDASRQVPYGKSCKHAAFPAVA